MSRIELAARGVHVGVDVPSPKGTSVTTRFIRTTWGMGGGLARRTRPGSCGPPPTTRRSGTGTRIAVLLSSSVWLACRTLGCATRSPLAAGTIVVSPVACRSVTAPILPGAEPYSATGDARGALVLHGFTGNPQSMRGLALALADAGFTVEMPLLPGHGTDVADMVPTRWEDWSAAAEAAYVDWRPAATRVVVVGLSMGGTLERLAGRAPPRDRGARRWSIRWSCRPTTDTSASSRRWSTAATSWRPASARTSPWRARSSRPTPSCRCGRHCRCSRAADEIEAGLESVTCPVLLFTSPQDHVVDPGRATSWSARSRARSSGSSWSAATTWPPSTTTRTRSRRARWSSSPACSLPPRA